jgi:hypothetical protein
MTYSHAVLWMDHQEGHLVRFNAESHDSIHVRAYEGKQKLHTRAGTLGTGIKSTKPSIRAKVLGIENSERITEPQLLAQAKKWFKPVDRMRAIGL